MKESLKLSISGHIKIYDTNTNEIIRDTSNDILYGNISSALANALIGDQNSFLCYMGFGNGGAYVNPTGTISYKPSLGGPSSLIKNLSANLYNTIYVKKISNDFVIFDPNSSAYTGAEDVSTNYTDVIINTTMGYGEPPTGIAGTPTTIVSQTQIDNSGFVGAITPTSGAMDPSSLVFNEIGLFVGSDNLFSGNYTTSTTDVSNFVNTTANFSPGTNSKLMITSAIFAPVQKSANRSLSVLYTLRIQMGT